MGAKNTMQEKVIHYSSEEAKGETPIFRCWNSPFDKKLRDTLPGGLDTMLKVFEYFYSL